MEKFSRRRGLRDIAYVHRGLFFLRRFKDDFIRRTFSFYFKIPLGGAIPIAIKFCNGFGISVRRVLHWNGNSRRYENGHNTLKRPSPYRPVRRYAQSFGLSDTFVQRILHGLPFNKNAIVETSEISRKQVTLRIQREKEMSEDNPDIVISMNLVFISTAVQIYETVAIGHKITPSVVPRYC